MICKLCKEEKGKLCKAHIVPEAFYRFMYPDKKVEGDSLILIDKNKDFTSEKRIGLYDTTILCSGCDNKIGKEFDQYGKELFLDKEPELMSVDGYGFQFLNVDVDKIKLFIISILWRYSISNLPEYSYLKLPEKFENQLYKMIKEMDAGEPDTFSIIITRFKYKEEKESFSKYMRLPTRARFCGVNYTVMYLPNGYKIIIKVDSRPQIKDFAPLTIKNGNPLYVLSYQNFTETIEFKEIIDNVSRLEKLIKIKKGITTTINK